MIFFCIIKIKRTVRAADAARTTELPGTRMTSRAWRCEQVIRADTPFGAAALPSRIREPLVRFPHRLRLPLNSVVGRKIDQIYPVAIRHTIWYKYMKLFDWDEEKNRWLKAERKISFDEIVFYIAIGNIVDIIPNKNQRKYPGQHVFVVNIEGYIHLVPFDETESKVFLRTIIPSRKATKAYLGGK
jgi:hypothetical protein